MTGSCANERELRRLMNYVAQWPSIDSCQEVTAMALSCQHQWCEWAYSSYFLVGDIS